MTASPFEPGELALSHRELLLYLRESDVARREAQLRRREGETRLGRFGAAVRRAWCHGLAGPSHWDLVWESPVRSPD
jgi:hypothetical protein